MASPLVQASLKAPAFLGLNTEQQAAQSQERFATVLDNAQWDQSGKLVCRKGFAVLASGGPDTVSRVFWWRKDRTTTHLIAVGDASGTPTVYDMTTTSTEYDTFTSIGTISTTDCLLLNVNGFLVIVQQGAALQYWSGTGSVTAFAAATGSTANPTGGVAFAGFGRLFVVSQDGKTVHGSDLQPNPSTGIDWDNWFIDTTGNSGATATDGFVYGRDFVTGLAGIGDLFCIMGTESLLVYSDVNGEPGLVDSITGVGCVNQQTLRNVGDDVLFLSSSGLRALSRTLEKETPSLNDASAFVRSDLLAEIAADDAIGVYSPLDGFYLLADGNKTYAFDMRERLPGGARRCSEWDMQVASATYDPEANRLFLAIDDGVCEYTDYQDDSGSYPFRWKSAWLDLGRDNIKIVKKLAALIYKGSGLTPRFSLEFDYNINTVQTMSGEILPTTGGDEWNVGEWGIAEWATNPEAVNYRYVQGLGSGLFVRFGLEFTVNGGEVGIQEVRMQAKLGKLAHV